jgi:hypothetical protein
MDDLARASDGCVLLGSGGGRVRAETAIPKMLYNLANVLSRRSAQLSLPNGHRQNLALPDVDSTIFVEGANSAK